MQKEARLCLLRWQCVIKSDIGKWGRIYWIPLEQWFSTCGLWPPLGPKWPFRGVFYDHCGKITLWFLTIADTQPWNSNKDNFMVGGYHIVKNCIKSHRKVVNQCFRIYLRDQEAGSGYSLALFCSGGGTARGKGRKAWHHLSRKPNEAGPARQWWSRELYEQADADESSWGTLKKFLQMPFQESSFLPGTLHIHTAEPSIEAALSSISTTA